jgi:photoactive yellow protein
MVLLAPQCVFAAVAMPLDTTTRMLAPFLDRLTDEELDSIPYGVVQLDSEGVVRSYNRAEAENVGGIPRPLGRQFFFEVCPSANVPELWGRFRQAIIDRHLDETFHYTFSCGPVPRRVQLRMYYSVRTKSVWLFVAKPDGSPLDRVNVPPTRLIRPTPSHGIDLRTPRVA